MVKRAGVACAQKGTRPSFTFHVAADAASQVAREECRSDIRSRSENGREDGSYLSKIVKPIWEQIIKERAHPVRNEWDVKRIVRATRAHVDIFLHAC